MRRSSVERRGRGGSSTRQAIDDSLKGMSSPSVRGIPSMCGGVSQGVPEIVVASHPCGDPVFSHPCGDSVCSHPGGDSVDVPDVSPRKMGRTTGSDGVQRRGQATGAREANIRVGTRGTTHLGGSSKEGGTAGGKAR